MSWPSQRAGGGSGHEIEYEGAPLTQRAEMNFTGALVSVEDSGGKTVVTIGGEAGTPVDRGPFSSVAGLPSAGLTDGDTCVLRLTGWFPIGLVWDATNSKWRAAAPLFAKVCDRVSGTTSASAQMASGWKLLLPAGLLTLYRALRVHQVPRRSGTTNNLTTCYVTLGSAGSTADAAIAGGGSPMIGSSNVARPLEHHIDIVDATHMRPQGTVYGMAYGNAQSADADAASVALTGSDDTGDALYLGGMVTMAGTTDTPSLSMSALLLP